jgi:hypothetical protein
VGRISTRNAGAVFFEASLSCCPGEKLPASSILSGGLAPEARLCSLVQTDEAAAATRRISCEIRAFYDEELTGALERTLRSVTNYAALTEAVLETRSVRLVPPAVTPATLVERLARQLQSTKLPVSFGPSWTPVFGADASVGTGGYEETLENFLLAHPAWRRSYPR